MQIKLELVPPPVSDVDRAIAFYGGRFGFKIDVDVQPSEDVRVVQLTRGLELFGGSRTCARRPNTTPPR